MYNHIYSINYIRERATQKSYFHPPNPSCVGLGRPTGGGHIYLQKLIQETSFVFTNTNSNMYKNSKEK